jgi:hypothetical protein
MLRSTISPVCSDVGRMSPLTAFKPVKPRVNQTDLAEYVEPNNVPQR